MAESVRQILHIDMDAFFVSVEEAVRPELRGKTVAVGGDPAGRGVVSCASYAARAHGVRSAMPTGQALRLCPQLILLRGSHGLYSRYSKDVFDVFREFTPDVEPVSIDEAYLDLTGFERLYGPLEETARRIREKVRARLGLPATVGGGTNRLIAKVAAGEAKPDGLIIVPPGCEAEFLAPLPVGVLPGVGPKTLDRLTLLGIENVGQLARVPCELPESVFGKWGALLWRKAHGMSNATVTPNSSPPKSIGHETTFQRDSMDMQYLHDAFRRLVAKVGIRLRRKKLRARTVTLKLRYSDFKTYTRSMTLKEPTDFDHVVFAAVLELFHNLYTRRVRVRLIGVQLNNLVVSDTGQLELFAGDDDQRFRSLYRSMDQIREKFGFDAISSD